MVAQSDKTKFLIRSNLLLLAVLIALFLLNGYHETLFYRPCSIHQWRQADCLSITKNYYEEGMHFFEPRIHFQGIKGGKAVSECPLLNYSVAGLWQLFGEREFIYRLLEYLIFAVSVFVLFNLVLRAFKSVLAAFFTVGLILSSPLITYYNLNFIADVPGFSLGLAGFCCFYAFYHTRRLPYFYCSLVLGTLAVLIKASALTGLCVLLFFSMADLCGLAGFFKTERLFRRKTVPAVMILLAVGMVIAWYRYALHYNNNNNNDIFLMTVLPIWDLDQVQLIHNLKILSNNFLLPFFLNKPMFFLFAVAALYVCANFKQLTGFLKYCFVFSSAFFVLYLVFFFQVFDLHDYYLVNIMIFPVITFICCSHILSVNGFIAQNLSFARWFVILAFGCNAFNAAAMYRLRMMPGDKLVQWYPFVSEDEINLANYISWVYNNSIQRIENFTPSLRDKGISRDDLVLSIPDPSFNISLYFMDQKGYTVTRDHLENDSTVMNKFLGKNIRYVVLSDTTLKKVRAYRKVAHHLESMFVKNNVEVLRFKTVY